MRNELPLLDRVFLIAAVLGTAVAYSALYLFHIVLALKIIESVTSPVTGEWRETRRILRWDVRFFAIFLLWYVISLAWAGNKTYAVEYCVYIILAALTMFYTAHASRTPTRLDHAFRLIFIAVSVEILVSLLEGIGLIRLPLSPYSPYSVYFERGFDLSNLKVNAYNYITSLPTGFFHNPNNLASFLTLILPFFTLHARWSVRVFGSIAILYVIYMCGARVAFIAWWSVIFVCAFVWGKLPGRTAVVGGALAAVVLGTGVLNTMMVSADPRAAEFAGLGLAISDFWDGLLGAQQFEQAGSASARATLIRNGLYALRASYGVGVGAGGSKTIQEQSAFQAGDLTSMHNFWVEILVEGGVFFALIFMIWYASLLIRLFKIGRSSTHNKLQYYGRSLFAGLIGFILGGIGASSVIYMLPMWMMVGVGLAVIRIDVLQRERADSGRAIYQHRSQGLRFAGAESLRQSSLE